MVSQPTSTTSVIAHDPRVQGGLPTIRGTRVTVHAVAAHCRARLGVAAIRRSFPQLCRADVEEAIRYYREHQVEIDTALDAEECAAP